MPPEPGENFICRVGYMFLAAHTRPKPIDADCLTPKALIGSNVGEQGEMGISIESNII